MDTIGNTPQITDKQAQYVTWLATPEDHRDPATETELAEELQVNRSTL